MKIKYILIIFLGLFFSILFFVKDGYAAYPYCSNGICVTGEGCAHTPMTTCGPACEAYENCPYGGSCNYNPIICSGSSKYYYLNCCYDIEYYYGDSCTQTCDCTNNCPIICGTCTPTCPSGSATSPVTAFPVTARCLNGSGCPDSTTTCYYQRQDLCNNTGISATWLKPGQSTTITSTATTNVNYFTYNFYNRENIGTDGTPKPICSSSYITGWATVQGSCPSGTYQLSKTNYYATARISETATIPANNIFIADANWGGRIVKYVQSNTYFRIEGRPVSLPDANCVEMINSCAPLCTPICGPTYATTAQYSSSGVYLGSTVMACSNSPVACGTESRTCYCYDCIQSCPAPLSATYQTTLPPASNLILDDFRQCTTGCGVARAEDCYEVASAQPEESIVVNTNPANTYGFLSLTHSGIPGTPAGNLNDPITMTATYRDDDSASQIEGIFVWFRNDTNTGEPGTPLWLSTTATPQAPSTDSWGFMMKKEGSSWVPYVPSYAVNPAVWTRALYDTTTGRFVIAGTSGGNMVGVTVRPSDIVTNVTNKTVSMRFTLKFSSDSTLTIAQPVSQIKYKVLLMGLDNFSFTPNDNYESVAAIRDRIDYFWEPNRLRYRVSPTPSQLYARAWVNPINPATLTNTTWTIDKGNPSISFTNGATPVVSGNTLRINWSASDDKSLYSIIGNIYVSDGNNANARPITLVSSTSSSGVLSFTTPFTPEEIEDDTAIGHLTQDVAFKIPWNMSVNTHTGSITVDIGENREGSILFYLTVFDDAGNMATLSQVFDLDDWFITDGGLAYSAQGTSFVTKRSVNPWTGILPPFTVSGWVESMTNVKADLSSEMWAEDISVLDNYSSGVQSYSINGHGGNDITDYYETLLEAYEERKSSIDGSLEDKPMSGTIAQGSVLTAGSLCGPTTYCVLRYGQSLRIKDNLRCNTKAVFFIDGDLTMEPPIRGAGIGSDKNAASNTFGCIFVVSGNLIIEEGVSASATSLGYDAVQGYFFVNGQVIIESEFDKNGNVLEDDNDGTKLAGAISDGVYINGGVHTGGGMVIERYLRLIDRLSYPVLAIDHHPKYGVLGGIFFGNNFTLQKVELGFKP